jgi:hypothetical protein
MLAANATDVPPVAALAERPDLGRARSIRVMLYVKRA